MASVFDIAARIEQLLGTLDNRKLNKLVFYVQAWSLVHFDQPAFPERIEAWVDGPVTKALWVDFRHNNSFALKLAASRSAVLSAEVSAAIDGVVANFGHLPAAALIDMTHKEAPWVNARGSLPPNVKSEEEITHNAMRDYYKAAWAEAAEDNAAAAAPPAFVGTVDQFFARHGF